MSKNIILEVAVNGEGQKLATLEVEGDGCGYRIAGPKSWGGSKNIARLVIKEADLAQFIREYAPSIIPQLTPERTPPRTYEQGAADMEHFCLAMQHIVADRLGSYTYGNWTLMAALTPEEVQSSHYRSALKQGAVEMREMAAAEVDKLSVAGRCMRGGVVAEIAAKQIRALRIEGE